MPKSVRTSIYALLFKDGVITVQKDVKLPKHHVLDVPNVFVVDALKSLHSKGLVKETFNWQWHYYVLTDEGVVYLRQYLNLPEEAVPLTHKKPAKPSGVREESARPRREFKGGEGKPRFAGEGGYRRKEASA
jgi:small subunit ribosomal protein S10e